MTLHLFNLEIPPTMDHKSTSTYRLLSSVADRPPRNTPIEYHLAISRFLLGDGLSDRLKIPPTSRKMLRRLAFAKWLEIALVSFGRVYVERWEVERVGATRTLISMLVCWQLGERRTRFTIKTFGADTVMPQVVVEGECVEAGEKEAEKAAQPDEDDDEPDPDLQMGPTAGKRIVGRWRWLLLEMAAVMVSPIIWVGCGIWFWRS